MEDFEITNGVSGRRKNQEDQTKREKWKSKTEYFLSSLGYCIGIGNVWRFPYLCYRSGGGAFLIPYLLMLFFCGIPLFFMETSLGQFSSTGCITLFRICPLFKGAGIAIIVVNFLITTYFVTLYAYPLLFLVYSFSSKLPWSECDNDWNTENCVKLSGQTQETDYILNDTSDAIRTPADEFFNNKILHISDSIEDIGGIVWPIFVCNLVSWLVTYLCVSNGVKSVGKVVYVTATFPFLILFVLLIRGITLPGAWKGIYFYIYPQWDQLTNFKVWGDAALQIFYSLGPGWGGIVNMASYNDFNNNNLADSLIISLCNSGTSIFAGFVVFSIIGFMAHQTDQPVSSVASGGPGLAYVTYPEAISMLPWPNFWAILFFLMLFSLGLDSAFVSIEAIVTSVTDVFPGLRRNKAFVIFACSSVMWLFSLIFTTNSGIYWLTLLDHYAASMTVILICLIEVIIVGWIYGSNKFVSDVEFMIKQKVSCIWTISWKVVTPIMLAVMLAILATHSTKVAYTLQEYPEWAVDLGWFSCFASMVWIPLYMGYHLLYKEEGDLIERLQSSIQPTVEWCPLKQEDKMRWIKKVKLKHTRIQPDKEMDVVHQQFVQLCTS